MWFSLVEISRQCYSLIVISLKTVHRRVFVRDNLESVFNGLSKTGTLMMISPRVSTPKGSPVCTVGEIVSFPH